MWEKYTECFCPSVLFLFIFMDVTGGGYFHGDYHWKRERTTILPTFGRILFIKNIDNIV